MTTLQTILKKQADLNALIEAFKTENKIGILIQGRTIDLEYGEHYAGTIIGKDGEQDYDLILLPDEAESVTWQAAMDWAKEQGGDLPNRREQSLLYTNLKEQFQESWYWSNTQHASYSLYTWYQYFGSGNQSLSYEGYEFRARAVRRLIINSVI